MKTLAEMTHYEILEVGPEVGTEELERAYRLARATYAEDSLAVYSVFGDEDSSALRERIELAYRVLADPVRRREYDAAQGAEAGRGGDIEIALDLAEEGGARRTRPEVAREITEFDAFEEEDEGPFDGARLRRARLRRGVEIEQIAAVTKINPTYVRFIEDEKFEDLPAPVYVRGFVAAYARCIGLDPARVVPGYMRRLDGARVSEPRSRQRGWR